MRMIALMMICCSLAGGLWAGGRSSRQYIDVRSCTVEKNKIVVITPEAILELKRLRTDAQGTYVCPSDILVVRQITTIATPEANPKN